VVRNITSFSYLSSVISSNNSQFNFILEFTSSEITNINAPNVKDAGALGTLVGGAQQELTIQSSSVTNIIMNGANGAFYLGGDANKLTLYNSTFTQIGVLWIRVVVDSCCLYLLS
jgi:hypothetical protein